MNQTPTITAFKNSPDRGRAMARDVRVRWALEEVAQPYHVKLVTFAEMKEDSYRPLQPFEQIPSYQQGDLILFESGAIVFHIAETHQGLLPTDINGRARAVAWMFSALNTLEQPILDREYTLMLEGDKEYTKERVPMLDQRVEKRLKALSERLGEAEWLDGSFSAGDLLMVTVLRRLQKSGLMNAFPNLPAYIARAEARPAYQRAYAAQLEVYNQSLKGS
jgi:glutathione S-transferase